MSSYPTKTEKRVWAQESCLVLDLADIGGVLECDRELAHGSLVDHDVRKLLQPPEDVVLDVPDSGDGKVVVVSVRALHSVTSSARVCSVKVSVR